MRFLRVSILSFAVVLGFSEAAAGAGFTIVDLGVASTVDDASSGMSDVVGEFITESPAHGTLFASVGLSTATTFYDFAWTSSFGQFLVTAAHEAEDVDSSMLFSRSSGGIVLAASQDLEVTIDAEYTYSAPATGFFTRLTVDVIDLSDNNSLFFGIDEGGPFFLGPPAGTLLVEGNLIIPGGTTYFLSYSMATHSFASGTGIIATADGDLAITLQTVPEPSTLFLVAVGSLGLTRRRRHCAKPYPRPSC